MIENVLASIRGQDFAKNETEVRLTQSGRNPAMAQFGADACIRPMQLKLAEHLGVVPAAIEIHPGSLPNEISQILAGTRALMDAL